MDLDVLVRDDLLTFLKTDSEARGATILCMFVPSIAMAFLMSVYRCDPHFRWSERISYSYRSHAVWRVLDRAYSLASH